MGFKEIKAAAGRAGAVAGILGALGGLSGDPVAKNTSEALRDTYTTFAKYGKEVRLRETEQEIARTLRRAGREKGDRAKGGYNMTTKDIMRLS